MIRVMHIISGLGTGGAEIMLWKLLSSMDADSFESKVVTMLPPGPVAARIRALGVEVVSLGMRRGRPELRALIGARAELCRFRPQIVQCWMYHANLLGGLAAAISGRTPVVWGIHHSDIIKQHTKVLSFVTSRACAVLSSWLPARIVCCAESAKAVHIEKGYAAAKMTVITNGIDVRTFQPAPELGAKFRQEQGILPTVPLFCHVARFHPQKDHLAFLRAVKLILSKRPDAHFALCGEDVTWENPALTGYIAALGIARDHIRLLGRVEDVRPVLNAAIAVVSSSYGEAFPVTLGEAMACGSVCVVTRVGDCEEIVGQQSGLVPARDPEALAKGCMDVLDMLPEQLHRRKLANRRRIEQRFSLPAMTRQYEVLYRELASESR